MDNRTLGAPAAMPTTTSPVDVGATLGAYKLVALLGEGGMGRVFLAEHLKLGRRVAIKLLRPEYAFQPEAAARFFAEARVVNQINHEHVVEIIDFIDGEGAEKYYVMELLRGTSLRDVGKLPIERVLKIMEQVAEALVAVHAANVVHRDLKPDNVFLIERGGNHDFVKLLDFGVAKLLDTPKKANQTAAGGLLGTPEYMAPEQLNGKQVDARADIYAVGIMLYELVSGSKPFVGESFGEIVVQHLTQPPPPLPNDVPSGLSQLIFQCLEKNPTARPASMKDVLARLKTPTRKVAPVEKSAPRRRSLLFPVFALLLIAAAAVFVARDRFRAPVAVDTAHPTNLETEALAPDPPPADPVPSAPASTPTAEAKKTAPPPLPDPPPEPKKKKKLRRVDRGGLIDPFEK